MATRPVAGLVLTLTLATGGAASAQLVDDISRNNALTHYRLGEGLFRDEQFAKAADEFQIAIKFDPLLTIAHYELGQSYMALRRYQEAIRAYVGCRTAFQSMAALATHDEFVTDQRRDDEIRELKDSIRQVQSGQIRIATGRDAMTARLEHRISDLERTKQRGQTSFETPAEVSLALGSAYFRSGDLPSAEREWKAAVAVNARLGEAHNNLAALYAMTGRKQQAQESVKQAERSGYQVNPRLKSDIQALAENPKPQTPNPKPQS
jgi:tetratricopeptide (TPR) repeat protein